MADIDMIPRSYRATLRARRLMARYGAALALLAVGGAAAGALLRWRVAAEMPRLEHLRDASASADALRARIAQAGQRRDALAQDARALDALRGAGDPAALAGALEAALNDKVWIEKLAFARIREPLHQAPSGAPPTGTVQVGAQAWHIGSSVDIAARAEDHAAMTAFLAALAASPRLADVRFLDSKAAPNHEAAVSFSVTGSLRPAEAPP